MEQTLSLYKIFNTVAKTGNISHAGKELYISQPAISKSISHLEEQLGVVLFIRTSRGVKLTPEGQVLYEHTKSAFDTIYQGEERLRKMQELGMGEIHIGVTTTLCKFILIPILKGFLQKYPHVKITIDCQSTAETISLLENGQLDLGLLITPSSNKTLSFYPYAEIEDIFVCTNTYLNHLKERFPDKEREIDLLSASHLMMLDKSNVTRQHLDHYFDSLSIETKAILEVTDMELLIDFAKIGMGISGVVKEFVTKELETGELMEFPIPFSIPKRIVSFAHHKSATNSTAVQNFLSFITEKKTFE